MQNMWFRSQSRRKEWHTVMNLAMNHSSLEIWAIMLIFHAFRFCKWRHAPTCLVCKSYESLTKEELAVLAASWPHSQTEEGIIHWERSAGENSIQMLYIEAWCVCTSFIHFSKLKLHPVKSTFQGKRCSAPQEQHTFLTIPYYSLKSTLSVK